jgi:hypothetical protein
MHVVLNTKCLCLKAQMWFKNLVLTLSANSFYQKQNNPIWGQLQQCNNLVCARPARLKIWNQLSFCPQKVSSTIKLWSHTTNMFLVLFQCNDIRQQAQSFAPRRHFPPCFPNPGLARAITLEAILAFLGGLLGVVLFPMMMAALMLFWVIWDLLWTMLDGRRPGLWVIVTSNQCGTHDVQIRTTSGASWFQGGAFGAAGSLGDASGNMQQSIATHFLDHLSLFWVDTSVGVFGGAFASTCCDGQHHSQVHHQAPLNHLDDYFRITSS